MTGDRLRPFVLLSLLVHAAVIAAVAPLGFRAGAPIAPVIDVALDIPSRPAPGGSAPPAPEPDRPGRAGAGAAKVGPQTPRVEPMQIPPAVALREADRGVDDAATPSTAVAPAAVSTASAADPASQGVPDPEGRAVDASPAVILDRLRDAVHTHFYYPALARRKGWEGQVTVGVRVRADGRLTDIRVIRSSGYRILDSAAVDCLRRASRLPGINHSVAAGLDVVLPVRYVLIDSPA